MDDQSLLQQASKAASAYLASLPEGPVGPNDAERAALTRFALGHLENPLTGTEALELLAEVGGPGTMRTAGGRYFGFVNGGTHPVARAAATLATTWDQNAALAIMSPTAARIDEVAATWLLDVLGLPAGATAGFCGGATIANLTGIIAGRDELLRRAGWDVGRKGLCGAPPIRVITGAEVHISALKALRLAGIGSDAIMTVPTDESGAVTGAAVERLVHAQDPQQGSGPVLAILQSGNVNTGASDRFDEIIPGLHQRFGAESVWVHVDGAFGLWASAAPNRRHLNTGVERADSWATDGHKFLNTPYDCGVVACADPEALDRSMAMTASYVAPSETADGRPERAAMNLGLQMSQAARAIPVWAILATEGRAGIADRIETACALAERFAGRLTDAGAELLAPVVLNQALVSFPGAETDRVVQAVQADGITWMGATTWQGRAAMRISISSFATTESDIDVAASAVIAAWKRVTAKR